MNYSQRMKLGVVVLLAIAPLLALGGCAASPSAPVKVDSNADVCMQIADEQEQGELWKVVNYFGAYTSDRESVDRSDLLAALDILDTVSDGTSGELADSFRGMRNVLEAIDARYVGDDPLAPVDYQAFQDEANAMFDACIAELDTE